MKKTIIIMMLLLLPVASAQEVIVEPVTYSESNISLVGGDNISQVLRVKYTGNTNAVAMLTTEIEGTNEEFNGNEINVTYEPGNQVILEPNQWKNITMYIASVPHLMPDSYSIVTRVSVEQETVHYSSSSSSGRSSPRILYILNNTVVNNTCMEELEELKEEFSIYKQENPLDEAFNVSKLYQKINQTEDEIEELKQEIKDAYLYLLLFIISAVLFSYIIGVWHVSRNNKLPDSGTQRGKEHKESTGKPKGTKKD